MVCHIELGGSRSVEELLKDVLRKLTSSSEELLQRLDEGECRNILKNRSSWRQKTFLAVDNVWDDSKSMEQAKMLLKDPAFCEGSVVMVTSRCRSTLMRLGIYESHCFEVPELGEVDARKLFLYHTAKGEGFDNKEDNQVIAQCLARCLFRKSETQGYHYLPLALKVLGVHLGYFGDNPSAWLEGLPKVRDFNLFGEENSVFDIIRLNYDRLSEQLQALFMDVALFNPNVEEYYFDYLSLVHGQFNPNVEEYYFDYLSLVHGQELQDTRSQLQQLRERGLVEDVNIDSGRVSMHDLYAEFAKMEAEGKLSRSVGFQSRRWVYSKGSYPSDLKRTPSGRCWANLIRVRIRLQYEESEANFNLHGIQLRFCSNLVVLMLHVLVTTTGVLSLKGLTCLRSLVLKSRCGKERVEGVEDLNDLRYFSWVCTWSDGFHGSPYLGQLPASLEILELHRVDVCLRSNVFDCCENLRRLSLRSIGVSDSMDFSQCSSLRSVYIDGIKGLQKLSGLVAGLQSLEIHRCKDLSNVSGLGDLVRLDRLVVYKNHLLEDFPDLHRLTSLQFLKFGQTFYIVPIAEVRGLGGLRQLRELHCESLRITELPDLSALEHLHVLSLEWCTHLTTLEGLAGLTAFQSLDLTGCRSLSRLPDLSNWSNLESLELGSSGIELHEEDIDMLAALPSLRIIKFDVFTRLDPVRRKTVRLEFVDNQIVEEERNLESFPVKIRKFW